MIVRNHFYFIVFLSVDEAIKSLRILENFEASLDQAKLFSMISNISESFLKL